MGRLCSAKRMRAAFGFLLLVSAFVTGCSKLTIAEIFTNQGISFDSSAGGLVEIRYLTESNGSNFLHTIVSEEGAVAALYGAVVESIPTEKPETEQFSPEYSSDIELLFSPVGFESVSFYYLREKNLLIYLDRTKGEGNDPDIVQYRYFMPSDDLSTLVSAHKTGATLKEENTVKPFRNMEELKASIDDEELVEVGVELDFEFYDGPLPANSGTACVIYSSIDDPAIPPDRYIVIAYGEDDEGKQVKLSIQGMEANRVYTKFFVSPPDEALDSVVTGNDGPNASAITVMKDTIDINKWIIFLDADGHIYDVILPEDLTAIP